MIYEEGYQEKHIFQPPMYHFENNFEQSLVPLLFIFLWLLKFILKPRDLRFNEDNNILLFMSSGNYLRNDFPLLEGYNYRDVVAV